ncbi:hypothetical protein Tco_1016116 [Tanacetum coccineum]|uniref:Uncharacterized protein n=1 Tax=Tanacetum coccineum TaxID=301880 RepID=A0ABQ5FMU7_9ASTR
MSSITAQQTKLDLELVPKGIQTRQEENIQAYFGSLQRYLLDLPKSTGDLVPVDEEPVIKGKRVKKSIKKSTTKPATGIVIREPPVETKSKRKEKVDVNHGKGIDLLSEVALTEEAHMKEITPTVTMNELVINRVPDVTKDNSTESESESWGNDEDNNNNEQESSNEGNDDNLESESDDVIKSDEEKGMDDNTYQIDDDVDARLKDPTQTDKEVVQGEGADAEMNDAQQGNENLETTQEQVVEDAHVTISTVTKKTEVPVTSSSRSFDLASKFLNFSDIPHTDAGILSPLDIHVHHEVPRT